MADKLWELTKSIYLNYPSYIVLPIDIWRL